MPDFRNLNELSEYMKKKVLPTAIKKVGNTVKDKLKDRIDKDVYSFSPSQYERTYQLRESVVVKSSEIKKDEITVEIGHDYDLINAIPPNKHVSVADQSDVSYWTGYWINFGQVGGIFGQGFWTKPRPYMDNTKKEIKKENTLKKELKKNLKKMNINTSD